MYKLKNRATNEWFAMKEIEISDDTKMQLAVSEAQILIDVMVRVAHPNIMEIKKVYHIGNQFYLLFPLCEGGELIGRVRREKRLSEHATRKILRDLVSALHAMHQQNILHLDIKPENIMFESDGEDARIKLTDFGLSRVYSNQKSYELVLQEKKGSPPSIEQLQQRMKEVTERGVCLSRHVAEGVCGTIGFISPELIVMNYRSCAADVFAAGVVFYVMLCGYAPFQGRSDEQTIVKTLCGKK